MHKVQNQARPVVVRVKTVVSLEWEVTGRVTMDFWGVGQMLLFDPGVS